MAVLSASCCLNLTPPPSNPASTPESLHPKESHLGCSSKIRERQRSSWKSRCLVGAATVIVGLEVICSDGIGGEQQLALAWDSQQQYPTSTVASKALPIGPRWSDRRMCPSWRFNSLETIVPENLPRPFAHRRWEAAEFRDASSQLPSRRTPQVVIAPTKCFSL